MRVLAATTPVILGLLLACCGCSSGPGAGLAALGKLQVVKGTATVKHGTATSTVQAGGTAALSAGDTISTGSDSTAVVLSAKQVHLLGADSRLTLESSSKDGAGAGRVSLLEGVATFLLPPKPTQKPQFEAAANSVVAAVHGTIFRFESSEGETRVSVVRGEVEVRPDGEARTFAPVILKEGDRATVKSGALQKSSLPAEELSKIRTEILLNKHLCVDLVTF